MHSIHIRNASRYSHGNLISTLPPCTAHKTQIPGDIQRYPIPLLCASPASDSISTGLRWNGSDCVNTKFQRPASLVSTMTGEQLSATSIKLPNHRPVHAVFLVFVQLGFIYCIPAPRPSFFVHSFLWTSPAASFLPPTVSGALCRTLPSCDHFV